VSTASQVALVTGATQGIGRAIAITLAEAGASVGVLARTERDVHAVVGEIRRRGGTALAIPADVTQPRDVERAFQTALNEFSTLDILVNNAGTGIRKPFEEMTPSEWDSLIDLNLKSVLYCTRAALQHMIPRQQGCIINIASRAGRQPEPHLALYSATKAAVIAFSQALAREVGKLGIRVIAVCPGPVDTERIRQSAPHADRTGWLTPEDVAHAVAFLASPLAEGYNGAVLDLFE
jgi:NAD(P)-dependent dehydrogenase (short-subunit alcohol dehydrogenase family)